MKNFILLGALFATIAISQAAEVDLKNSDLEWKGTKVTGEHVGKISFKEASLDVNKKGLIKKGKFVVDMNTVKVTDLEGEWADKLKGHLLSKDFFEAEKFPTANLVVNKDDGKKLKGKLTIKGKTQKVEIPYTKSGDDYKGVLKFDRTKFDMIYGSGDFFKELGDKMIHNEVTLNFNIKVKNKAKK